MIDHPESYSVFAEKNDQPEDWDWSKQGIYRGERTRITSLEDLKKYLFTDEYTICYDIEKGYYDKYPYPGEAKSFIKETFNFKYSGDRDLEIKEVMTAYTPKSGEPVHTTTLELLCYSDHFGESCFVIAYWTLDEEGYEFKSVGSRFFDYLSDKDLKVVMSAIREADKFLKKKFESSSN